MGPSPITYETIDAYIRVTGNPLAGWEIRSIKRLDAAWLKVQSEKQEYKQAPKKR